MAKLVLGDITNITGNESSATATLNANNQATEDALENTLSRDGTSPNEMNSDLDMNAYDIINVGEIDTEVLRIGGIPVSISGVGVSSIIAGSEIVIDDSVPSSPEISVSPILETVADKYSADVKVTGRFGQENQGGQFIYQDVTTADPVTGQALRTQGNFSYSGGTGGFVSSTNRVITSVSAAVANYIWGFISTLSNAATGGQNVAGYFQATKQSTGPTWAGVFEAEDTTESANPTTGLYGLEIDVVANGTDSNNTRSGVDIIGFRSNAAGADVEIGAGLLIQPSTTDIGHVKFKRGVALTGAASFDVGIDLSGATYNTAAMQLAATALVDGGYLTPQRVTVKAGTTSVAPVTLTAGTNVTTPAAGAFEYDGVAFYATSVASSRQVISAEQISTVVSDRTGSDVNTFQAFFANTQDVLTLAASTTYEFEAQFWIVRSAGTTSHTTSLQFGGTAAFGGATIDYFAEINNQAGNVLGPVQRIAASTFSTVVVTAANTDATENVLIKMRGIIRTSSAGSIQPGFVFSAAPGGAPTIKRNSFFRIWPVGSSSVSVVGNWG